MKQFLPAALIFSAVFLGADSPNSDQITADEIAAIAVLRGLGAWAGVPGTFHVEEVRFNKQCHDSDLIAVKSLSNLRRLVLCSGVDVPAVPVAAGPSRISDAGLINLVGLRKLESLDVSGTPITGAGFANLKGIATLKKIDANWTDVDDTAMKNLEMLTGLEELILFRTKITDQGMASIGKLRNLRILNVAETAVTDAGLEHLRALPKLQELSLNENITDTGLAYLEGLTELRVINIDGAKITDAGVKRLARLEKLNMLFICADGLTDASLDFLGSLPSIKRAELHGKQFTWPEIERVRRPGFSINSKN